MGNVDGSRGANMSSADAFFSCVQCDLTTADTLCTLIEHVPDGNVHLDGESLLFQSTFPMPQSRVKHTNLVHVANSKEPDQMDFVLVCLAKEGAG
jgi:hypothetical protein